MSDNLHQRAVAFTLTRSDADPGDGLTLEGYAATFNSPTLIDDWDGRYEEVISPGAFKQTIHGGSPVLQFEHGRHPLYGSLPIGSIQSLAEDARGLFVRARLFDNWLTEPLRHAIADGAVDGMSFRFEVIKDIWEKDREPYLRTLKEVRLHELGPVVFPAYKDTTVALRSLTEAVPGLTLTMHDAAQPPDPGTLEEPAVEGRSEEAATQDDPATSQSPPNPSTVDERKRRARQIEAARMGAGKK